MPFPVTFDPLEGKDLIRHLIGTNKKPLNNLNYNKNIIRFEDQYFQENLEQFQTLFTSYQCTNMYTGTFTFMSAAKTWIYDPKRSPLHNCHAHRQFEVNKSVGDF